MKISYLKQLITGVVVVLMWAAVKPAHAQLKIVTTLPDLQNIAEEIGGDKVSAFSIATGYQNPHFVDPKPSYILQLSRADMFITIGLDLEIGWVPPLLNSARNAKIMKGAPGYVDASTNVPLLNKPTSISREQGDIHIYGNPHYWLDPERGKIIARNIYDGLVRLSPSDRAFFEANLNRFNETLDLKMAEWKRKLQPYEGTKIIAYHDQWPYFEAFSGLDIVDFLEPKPGIPPTPSQLAKVIRIMQQQAIKVLIISPYFKQDAARLVAGKADAQVVTLATSVGATSDIKSYFDLFDYNINQVITALR